MNRVFKRRKPFFLSLLSVVFLYTANRPDENELIQLFELSQKGHLYTGQRVHKIRVFIPEVIYSARNGLLVALFTLGGTPHNDLYGEAPRERGTFLGFRYTKEQRFHQLKHMKGQENASFRSVKRPKRTRITTTLLLFIILCIAYIFVHLYCYLGIVVNISGQLICFIHIEITTASV